MVNIEILEKFKPVTLKELDRVALLNRIDIKYVFKAGMLNDILNDLSKEYFILEMNGKRFFEYSTMYYDTHDAEMYVEHVRGKLNRYKVRHRVYMNSGDSFLEVKFKNNKNRTIKWRTQDVYEKGSSEKLNRSFLRKHIPYDPSGLIPSLKNKFIRLTLVDKGFTQRVTLDFKLGFNGKGNKDTDLHQLAIAELKIDKDNKNNTIQEVLRKHKIQPSGFSKYCIGKTLADDNICRKERNLKPKLLKLNKIANEKIYSI